MQNLNLKLEAPNFRWPVSEADQRNHTYGKVGAEGSTRNSAQASSPRKITWDKDQFNPAKPSDMTT